MLRAINRVAWLFAMLGGRCASLVAAMTVVSVAGRARVSTPIQGDVELTQLGVALCISLCLPWGQIHGANIVVDFFTQKARPRATAILDGVGAIALAAWMTTLTISPLLIVAAILFFFILLGCVMDELSMLLLTIPVLFPAVMGMDLWGLGPEDKAIWFAILVLMVVGIGLVAPPVGLNVYVVNSLAKGVSMNETYKGVMPFVVSDIIRTLLLLFFPVIALGLVAFLK